jgi:glycosyltransferase involved in cell wall biosynthesis
MSSSAPIVIFAYKRADHLRRTLDSLKKCEGFADSKLIVFGDGPKTQAENDAVEATRRTAQAQLGAQAEYHFRADNAGLAGSIIAGVSEVTRRFGRAVVLEDDLELSPNFLIYMNAALDRYAEEAAVYQVSGQLFDTPELRDRRAAIFLPFTTSWGWGTWRRAWERFDSSADGWDQLKTDRLLRRRFNLDGCYDFSTMLERQMAKLGDSWAIRWYWSVFRNQGVVCFPPTSLVRNTGMDGSGTHGRGLFRRFRAGGELRQIGDIELPGEVVVREQDFNLIKKALWRQNGGYMGSAVDTLRRFLFKLTGRHM